MSGNKLFAGVVAISLGLTAVQAVSAAAPAKPTAPASDSGVTLTGKYTLKNPKELGNGIKLSIGSSLVHLPGDPDNIFYSTADRGPNGEVQVGKEKRRTFPLEKYTPSIYKIELKNGDIHVLEEIPLKLATGTDPITGTSLISGVSNLPKEDETPYDAKGIKQLTYDPYGLDLEGIAYSPQDNTFWLCDEYRPSLVQVKRDGTIIQRLMPAGMAKQFEGASYVYVRDMLPAVYAKRIPNRGFEGVAITPDGKWMYAVVQNALANPDLDTGKKSRTMRIIKIDLKQMKVVGEYAYLADSAKAYEGLKQFDIVVSDLYAVNEHTLLVDERDKYAGAEAKLKKVYKIDLSQATNILGKYDAAQPGKQTLEQMSEADMAKAGIVSPKKSLLVDILKFGYPYEKIEGISLVNGKTLAIVNDNDFGIDNTTQTGVGTELWTFELPTVLK